MNTADEARLTAAVHETIRQRYPGAPWPLTDGMRFGSELAGDSLSYVELVTDVEGRLRITLPDERAAAVRTVGEFVGLVRSVSGGGSPSAAS